MSHTPSRNGMFDSQGHGRHEAMPHQLDETQRVLHAEATDPSHHQPNSPHPQLSRETERDEEWVQANVDQASLERLVSDYLHRMSQRHLQSILHKVWHKGCGLPIGIYSTDALRLLSVEADERGQTLYATYQTSSEVEADVDPVNGYPCHSESMTFDLETFTTVRLTIEEDYIADMSLEEVIF